MTCKNCVNYDECLRKSQGNPDHAHRMWMYDFWDNAEERCRAFEKNNECGEKKQMDITNGGGRV